MDHTTVSSIGTFLPEQTLPNSSLPSGPLTFEAAAQKAVSWHPSIAQAAATVRQRSAGITEAEVAYWPQVSWGLDSSTGSGGASSNPQLTLSGKQALFDFGKTASAVELAAAGTERSQAELALAVDKLAYETTKALIEVRRHRALLAIAEDRARDIGAIVDLVRARTEQGAGTQSDMLQAETRAQAARSAALQIQRELGRWESTALSLTGTKAPLRLAGNMPSWLNGSCAPAAGFKSSPAYLDAVAKHAMAVAELDKIRAEAMPSLELQGQVGADLARLGQTEPDYRIGLRVGGSLNSFGASAARAEGAEHAVSAAEAAIRLAELEAQMAVSEVGSQLSTLKRLQRVLQESQAGLDSTRTLYRTQYAELGTRTLLDLLNAEDEYHTARHDAANIGFDLNSLSLDCVRSTGKLAQSLGLSAPTVTAAR